METLVTGYELNGILWIAEVQVPYHSITLRRSLSLAEHA